MNGTLFAGFYANSFLKFLKTIDSPKDTDSSGTWLKRYEAGAGG